MAHDDDAEELTEVELAEACTALVAHQKVSQAAARVSYRPTDVSARRELQRVLASPELEVLDKFSGRAEAVTR